MVVGSDAFADPLAMVAKPSATEVTNLAVEHPVVDLTLAYFTFIGPLSDLGSRLSRVRIAWVAEGHQSQEDPLKDRPNYSIEKDDLVRLTAVLGLREHPS